MINTITRTVTRVVGAAGTAIFAGLTAMGVDVGESGPVIEDINAGITAIGTLVSMLVMAYGQFFQRDKPKEDPTDEQGA